MIISLIKFQLFPSILFSCTFHYLLRFRHGLINSIFSYIQLSLSPFPSNSQKESHVRSTGYNQWPRHLHCASYCSPTPLETLVFKLGLEHYPVHWGQYEVFELHCSPDPEITWRILDSLGWPLYSPGFRDRSDKIPGHDQTSSGHCQSENNL